MSAERACACETCLAFDYAVFPGAAQTFEVPGTMPFHWLSSEALASGLWFLRASASW